MNFTCILLAGGKGLRYGGQKQYELLKGKEVWQYPYEQCLKATDKVIVVGRDVPAGHTRQQSVYNGLVKVETPVVVIVEAVRPLVTSEQIKTIAGKVTKTRQSWAYAIPSNYTIYDKSYGNHLVREDLLFVQVPQAFWTLTLAEAHLGAKGKIYTCDTQLVEDQLNIRPRFLLGGMNLHKITYKEDLKMIEGLL